MDDDILTIEVGYKKPPKEHQFKKGKSGNPKGRPKQEPKMPQDLLEDEMQKKITVIENGQQRSITKLEAISKMLVNSAVKGDTKSIGLLLRNVRSY